MKLVWWACFIYCFDNPQHKQRACVPRTAPSLGLAWVQNSMKIVPMIDHRTHCQPSVPAGLSAPGKSSYQQVVLSTTKHGIAEHGPIWATLLCKHSSPMVSCSCCSSWPRTYTHPAGAQRTHTGPLSGACQSANAWQWAPYSQGWHPQICHLNEY